MAARSCAVVVAVLLGWITGADAGERATMKVTYTTITPNTVSEASANLENAVFSAAQPSTDVKPWVHASVSENMTKKLQVAFDSAVERIREVPECRALFEELGADGIETLGKALYFPAVPHLESTLCKRAEAYTYVGHPTTRLCRRFTSLSDQWAVIVVLHEALHGAGLKERPHHPTAMSSREINSMVITACGF